MNTDWNTLRDDCVDFVRRLIQIPSLPGEEAALAAVVRRELEQIGCDAVWQDEVGNLGARLFGRERDLPAVLLNSHLDHVDPGEPALWSSPPYAGALVDGTIIGRGASDIKGPLATQVYALAAFVRAGRRPRRDVLFSAVVEEETGGRGARHFAAAITEPIGLVVLSEPTANAVSVGHRGICQLWVTFHGRSAHASAPHKADNPVYALATFLERLRKAQDELRAHPRLGPTTVSPTLLRVDTTSRNVTPAWARVCLDFRTAAETMGSILGFVAHLADGLTYTVGDAVNDDPTKPVTLSAETIGGFDTDPALPDVQRAIELIAAGQGRAPDVIRYEFATDGRFFTHLAPIIGYSPGEEDQAHVADERISVARIGEALRGHVILLNHF